MRITLFSALALLLCAGFGMNMALAASTKVSVCHMTSSDKNPMVIISVSEDAVSAHLEHGDALLDANGVCSTPQTFACTGTLPAGAVLYSGDNLVLTENTPIVFSETDTAAKCEYSFLGPV